MQMSSKKKKRQSQKKIPTTLGTTVTASTGTNKIEILNKNRYTRYNLSLKKHCKIKQQMTIIEIL